MKKNHPVKGSCLCGRIKLDIDELIRDVVVCHCQQCRKQTGHMVAATRVQDSGLTIIGEEHIKWYEASSEAKRGFCSHCGSLLLWKTNGSDATSVMAGCLESPTGLEIKSHIFTDYKGDYYELNDGVPTFSHSDI